MSVKINLRNKIFKLCFLGYFMAEDIEEILEEDSEKVVEESEEDNPKDGEDENLEEGESDEVEFSLGGISLAVGRRPVIPVSRPTKKRPENLLEKLEEGEDEWLKSQNSKLEEESSDKVYGNKPVEEDEDSNKIISYDGQPGSKDKDDQAYDAGATRRKDFYGNRERIRDAADPRNRMYEGERGSGSSFYGARNFEAEREKKKEKEKERKSVGLIERTGAQDDGPSDSRDDEVYTGKYN